MERRPSGTMICRKGQNGTDKGVNKSGTKICKTKKGKKNTIIYKRRQKDHDFIVLVVICDWNKQEIHGGNISFPQFGNYVGSKPPCVYDEF